MAKLYADEDFTLSAVKELRTLGHDVLTAIEAGIAGQSMSDSDVLHYASREGRAVVTFNRRHFMRLHRALPEHAGIIACRQDTNSARLAARIDDVIRDAGLLDGKLLCVTRPPA